jgi:hypothetical protein
MIPFQMFELLDTRQIDSLGERRWMNEGGSRQKLGLGDLPQLLPKLIVVGDTVRSRTNHA